MNAEPKPGRSSPLEPHIQDARWFNGELKRRNLPEALPGETSAFAERVAIKLEGRSDPALVAQARLEAFEASARVRFTKPVMSA